MRYGYGYFEEDQLGQVKDIGLWQRIVAFAAPRWKGITAAILLSFVVTAATLTMPYLVRVGVDQYIVNEKLLVAERLKGISWLAGVFVLVVGLGFLANFFQVLVLEWTGQTIMHQMRQQVFSHMLELSLSFFNRNPTGKLVTRVTNDIQNMYEMFTSVIVTLFNDFIRIVGILIILFWMNWRLALGMTLLLPIILLNTVWFSRLARDAFRAIRTHLARINSYLQESLSGIAIIQLFLRERDAIKKFAELNQQYYLKTLYQIKIFGIFMPTLELFGAVATGGIIWYGGGEIIRGHMTIGILVAFISYMRLFFQPLRELSQKYSIVQSAMASAERIFQLMDTEPDLPVVASPLIPQQIEGAVEFRHVRFGYELDQPVLHDLSFAVPPGETLAIVGATGSGKSTIINLLERFYDPEDGEILIDGNNVKTLAPDWLRQQIGLVMQDVFIIPGSIKENILLDREMADEELEEIIDRAQLTGLMKQMPEGWDTRIGEGGVDLSAGQRQLLAFARVLAKNPKILVLDEATSSVDSETEILIGRAIEQTLSHRTSIVIAHRLSTIRKAHRIMVMERGRIAEQGTHQELMGQEGLYYHLHNLQNGDKINLSDVVVAASHEVEVTG